jgi:hypothetical protein
MSRIENPSSIPKSELDSARDGDVDPAASNSSVDSDGTDSNAPASPDARPTLKGPTNFYANAHAPAVAHEYVPFCDSVQTRLM